MCNYKFFSNKACEHFPCHKVKDPDTFNCLFCFCPLYALGDRCGGNYRYTEKGTKDCSQCLIPHTKKAHDYIMDKWELIAELADRK